VERPEASAEPKEERMRKLIVSFAVVLALPAGGARAVPPVLAGALATSNVDYVGTIPDVPAVGAKIIGDTMYVTTLQGLRIYDISLGMPVLMGALELPHWQNESVDTNGTILLISADNVVGTASVVFIIDVSLPQAPVLKSVVPVSNGHTATCIRDCQFVWARGGDVIDIRNPSSPVNLGDIPYGRHHADVDEAGLIWVDGSNVLDSNDYGIDNALSPTLVASGGSYGWHGSLRPQALQSTPTLRANNVIDPGELLVGTDEDWLGVDNGLCADDGPFKTSWFRSINGENVLQRLDTFSIGQGTLPDAKPAGATCSSHWFDWHDGVVADAWYEQGLRFLDVSKPDDIRQIGYFMPAVTVAWAARFHEVTNELLPEQLRGLYVYTFDGARGIDVLRFTGKAGDATQLAPRLNPVSADAAPSTEYGWACRVPAGGLPAA
jgi:hypothetical protein